MDVVRQARDGDLPIWRDCLQTRFLRGVRAGTLEEIYFREYMIENCIYLRNYARVFAAGLTYAHTMRDMRRFSAMIASILDGDYTAAYLQRLRISPEELDDRAPAEIARGYMRRQTRAVRGLGLPGMLMATLPCMLLYAYLAGALSSGMPKDSENHLYADWIAGFAGEEYRDVGLERAAYARARCKDLPPGRAAPLRALFHRSSLYERAFWEVPYQVVRGA